MTLLACTGDYRHVVEGTWQRGHVCHHPLAWTVQRGVHLRCGGTFQKVRWTAALRASAKLGGAAAVEAMLNA